MVFEKCSYWSVLIFATRKKMVLLGLSPDDCLQAALSGVRFWQHQLERTAADDAAAAAAAAASSSCSNGHEMALVAQWEKHYQITVAEMNQEINALREECHSKYLFFCPFWVFIQWYYALYNQIKL